MQLLPSDQMLDIIDLENYYNEDRTRWILNNLPSKLFKTMEDSRDLCLEFSTFFDTWRSQVRMLSSKGDKFVGNMTIEITSNNTFRWIWRDYISFEYYFKIDQNRNKYGLLGVAFKDPTSGIFIIEEIILRHLLKDSDYTKTLFMKVFKTMHNHLRDDILFRKLKRRFGVSESHLEGNCNFTPDQAIHRLVDILHCMLENKVQ